ncbi:hypothetical protein [Massilia antarctica]|uniref:hypothetical protein n=1 Tax=Massilia antarctica TaxID=2765360 RepID=UPI00226F6D57|nr:hypothetical protein [Massilia sp. H27-R4]MCY0910830.1 hypothetical protein [Massilia sp. H27-R4]
MTITQVITALPAAPNPATDTPTTFSEKAAASVLAQMALPTEINAWRVQANALESNVNAKESNASGFAADALGYKNTAQLAADAAQGYRDNAHDWADAAAASATTIGTTAAFSDANSIAKNAADNSKQVKFNLSAITTGTTRTVTLPNKSGTLAMTDDGGLVFLGEIILGSAAASIDFLNIFSSAYDRYMITGEDLRVVSGTATVRLRFAVGGSVDSTTNSYGANSYSSTLTLNSTSLYLGDTNNAANGGTYFEFIVHDTNSVTNTNKRTRMIGLGTATTGSQFHGAYYRATAAALSGFSIINDGGVNFATGAKVRVYGFKKA